MTWDKWRAEPLSDILFDSNRPAPPMNLPAIDEHAIFVSRIIGLLRDFFPEEAKDASNFKFVCQPKSIEEVWLRVRKNPEVLLKFSVGETMTVVMVVVVAPRLRNGVEVEQRSQAREGFQNTDWDSFVGWVSYVASFIQKEVPQNGSDAT